MTMVYIKNTDSIFYNGDADIDGAIYLAKEAYLEKYPEEEENIDNIEWSVVEDE